MRISTPNRLLGILCVLCLAQFAYGDLVITSVSQEVNARAPLNLVTQTSQNTELPPASPLTVIDVSANGLAEATQTLSLGPTAIGVVTSAIGTAAPAGLNIAAARSISTLTFTLSLPHTYDLLFGGGMSNGGSNAYLLEGPAGGGVSIDAPGAYSGVLQAGDYALRLESIIKAGPGVTANASGTASLSLAAVPEPAAFVLVGLVAAAVLSTHCIRQRCRPRPTSA